MFSKIYDFNFLDIIICFKKYKILDLIINILIISVIEYYAKIIKVNLNNIMNIFNFLT